MMLEDDLRATLRERAADPAVRPDLLDEVRGGIRRSNRRRAAVLGAAVLLVAAISVPVALTGGRSPAPQSPVPAGPAGWERPRLVLPTFPLAPGWVPSGFGAAEVGQAGDFVMLSYERAGVNIQVGPVAADWEAEGDGPDRRVALNGRAATVRTVAAGVFVGNAPGDRYVGVRWQLPDRRWAQLISAGPSTENEVLRFVRGLRDQGVPAGSLPFTVAAAPPGLILHHLSEDYLCLSPPAAVSDRDDARGVCLSVAPAADEPVEGDPVTVGGRAARLAVPEDGATVLSVFLPAGRVLSIEVNQQDVPMSRDELIRFGEGVAVAG